MASYWEAAKWALRQTDMKTAPDVHMIKDVGPAPIYLLASEGELTLIDAGLVLKMDKVIAGIERAGCTVSDLKAIVLTHYHHDHVGCAAGLSRLSGAKIAAHQDEVVYITREKKLPAKSLVKRLLFRLFDRLALWAWDPKHETHIKKVDLPLKEGDIVKALGGLQVLHVPGHTPGSIALYHPIRQMLFCGDTITNRSKIRCSPWHASVDVDQARHSARRLASYPVEVAYFGHGDPILEQAGLKIKEAIDRLPT
jgi:glyoxylase-like metal-dependent hydrolase (beta-lactamase superfamily II)